MAVGHLIRRAKRTRLPALPLLSSRRFTSTPLGQALRDAAVIALFGLLLAMVYRDAIWHGAIPYENDTVTYYLPAARWLAEGLRQGQLPLWTPDIFTGHPLFADGEAGPLNPLNLILLGLLPFETAIVALLIVRPWLAAVFTYLFARTLGLGRAPAAVAGLVFSLGSFLAGQVHHSNVVSSALWLPLVLALIERGIQERLAGTCSPWRGWRWFVAAGLPFGLAGLGLHPQPILMAALVVGLYVPLRAWGGGVADPHPLTPIPRFAFPLTTVVLGGIPIGMGLAFAAVQLVPLVQLAQFSFRGLGVTYQFATAYPIALPHLVGLVFPFLFRSTDGEWWTLWSRWETLPYAGLATLLLAAIALARGLRPLVLVFTTIGLLGLWVGLADQVPLDLHYLLWNLPGFSLMRAPGRFSYVVIFALALLAGLGLQALERVAVAWSDRLPAGDRRPATRATYGPVLPLLLVAAPIVLAALVLGVGAWLRAQPLAAQDAIQTWYLGQRRADETSHLTAQSIYQALTAELTLANPEVQLALAVAATLALLVALLVWRPHPVWPWAIVALVAIDLGHFATAFHPTRPIAELEAAAPAARFLQGQAGLLRVAGVWSAYPLEPNRLLSLGVQTLNGYSSLPPQRVYDYVNQADGGHPSLWDLAGVGYFARGSRMAALPSGRFAGVPYYASHPILASGRDNPNGQATFMASGPLAGSLRLVSALSFGAEVSAGEEVAAIVVADDQGRRRVLAVRAGEHTAEERYGWPGVQPRHPQPVVAQVISAQPRPGQPPRPAYLYFSELALAQPMAVRQVEVRVSHPTARLRLYGLGLADRAGGATWPVGERAGRTSAYRDPTVSLRANPSPLPRAYVAFAASLVPDGTDVLDRLADAPFDPRRDIVLEELPTGVAVTPEERAILAETAGRPEGKPLVVAAEVTAYERERVALRTTADRGGVLVLSDHYYPGWRAYLDGREVKIFRANYLFRAIVVPPGSHRVEFRFVPFSTRTWQAGLLTSGGAVVVMLLTLVTAGNLTPRPPSLPGKGES